MNTLRQFAASLRSVPVATSWYMADIAEALGKQQLYTKQSPQRLKVLRELSRGIVGRMTQGPETPPSANEPPAAPPLVRGRS